MEQASNAAPKGVGPRRRGDSVSREEGNLASNGDGAGSRKRPRLDPDDLRNHHSTRSITAAAAATTSSESRASETAAAELLEDEWKRFARKCTENVEEQIMHRIEEEVRREKRKMEATPEWDRAVAEVQQLERRFHTLWLQWARDEEARRIDEAYRARRTFFAGHRTPPPAKIPQHGEKRGDEDRRRSDRELRRSEQLPQEEDERRRSRDRGTSHTRAREQSEPSAKRPRSRSRSRSRGRRIKEEPPDEEIRLGRREQRILPLWQDQQRQAEESERRVARELHEQKQREQEEEAEMDEEEEEEQAFPDSGSLPPPQRGVRFRHRCEMCQVTLNSQKQMFEHFRGKKHVQGEERLRQMTGQGPSPATYPPSGQALNWQNQRDWRADDEMNWEREKARGWSKLPTPLSASVKPEPRDDAGDTRAHEVSTGTELAQQPTCSVAGKQASHAMRDGGQAAKEAERERPARIELDLNVVSDDEEAEIQQEEAAPRLIPVSPGSAKVVNLFGINMVFTDDDDDDDEEEEQSSGEDSEGDSKSSGSGDEEDFDEDSDEEHGEEPGGEEVDDDGEETERYWYTDDEDGQQEEEQRAEGARVESATTGGAPDVAEAIKTSTTSSQPRKPGFLLSATQRRKNWEAKYALVKAWFDEHGRLPSKEKSKTLYNWLHYYKISWSQLDPSQRARLRTLGVKPFRRQRSKDTTSSRAKEEVKPEPLRDSLPTRRVRTGGETAMWEGQLRKLERFRAATDGQNPPYFLTTGQWLYEQIALQNRGLLSSSRQARLESLGVKWNWKDEFANINKSGCEKAKKWNRRAERAQDSSSDTEEKEGSARTKERENERGEGKEKKRETKEKKKKKKEKKEKKNKKMKKEKATSKKRRRRAEEEMAKKKPKKRLKREGGEKEKKEWKGHTKVPWEVRYEELCQYLAAHDQQLPGRQTTLGKWIYTQQYRINKGLQAQEDKIAKLVALGITLSPPKTPTPTTTPTTTTTTTTIAAALPEPELQDNGGATEDDELGSTVSATMQELLQRIKEEKL